MDCVKKGELFMYIYTSQEIKEADAQAAEKGMSLFALMENAGAGLFREIEKQINKTEQTLILSGKGNNGGDGIVLARYMKNNGFKVSLVFPLGEPQTPTAKEHYAYFQACGYEAEPFSEEMKPDWIIDSLLGVGSQLPLRSDLAKITTWINQQQKKVIAIDLPTGTASDDGCVDEYAVRAEYTISLHGFKPSAFLFPSSEFYGETISVDIGIPNQQVEGLD